ncbi:MAG: hypothetical protein M1826_001314 [Phylliscum demangeonii]|nr:MAG: hypothetical protein M1826_001314 [Phylliscum demangeonii]
MDASHPAGSPPDTTAPAFLSAVDIDGPHPPYAASASLRSFASASLSSASSPVFSLDGRSSSQSSAASSTRSAPLDVGWDSALPPLSAGPNAPGALDAPTCARLLARTGGAAVTISPTSSVTSSRSSSSSASGASDPVTAAAAAAAPTSTRHPRRGRRAVAGDGATGAGLRAPPSLVRQHDRRVRFVDGLVDSAAQIIEVIWPLANVARAGRGAGAGGGARGVLPLKTFVQETLRRSRTSYSTLQVALYYLISIKSRVPAIDFTQEQPDASPATRALQCGRRMFLAALILASKYLQDRNYSARAWSKISGLSVHEVNVNERTFLAAIHWRLHVPEPTFQRWTDLILKYTAATPPSGPAITPPSSLASSAASSPPSSSPASAAAFAGPSSPPPSFTSLTASPSSAPWTALPATPPSSSLDLAPTLAEGPPKANWTTIVAALTPESLWRSPTDRSLPLHAPA